MSTHPDHPAATSAHGPKLRVRRLHLLVLAATAVAAIGFVDYITSWELSLFVFYGVPVFLVAWLGDRRSAIFFALICAVVWYIVNTDTNPYQSHAGYLGATLNRLAYFLCVAVGGTAMRMQRESHHAHLRAVDSNRELEQEIARVAESQQVRIGQELHDGVCQDLAAISCAVACLRDELTVDDAPSASKIDAISKMLRHSILEARTLARGILPVQLTADGLCASLEELASLYNELRETRVHLEVLGDQQPVEPTVAQHLYRIAQEAISNAARHGRPAAIHVTLHFKPNALELEVRDDGTGFSPETTHNQGLGLRGMRYRAQLLNASFSLQSAPAKGCAIHCIKTHPYENAPAYHFQRQAGAPHTTSASG